jgi:hypothetical protein
MGNSPVSNSSAIEAASAHRTCSWRNLVAGLGVLATRTLLLAVIFSGIAGALELVIIVAGGAIPHGKDAIVAAFFISALILALILQSLREKGKAGASFLLYSSTLLGVLAVVTYLNWALPYLTLSQGWHIFMVPAGLSVLQRIGFAPLQAFTIFGIAAGAALLLVVIGLVSRDALRKLCESGGIAREGRLAKRAAAH